ncbi:MAG: signal peptidase I [Parcubacteria bacterium C7867-005]|nr:MAG: signal peptidase I [Parcubacteria bacterium C7867-005]
MNILPPNITPEREESKFTFWFELGKLLLIAVFVVIPFRMFVAQPFIVDGASMDPTFYTGQYLIVDELSYKFTTPLRGSVMIFKYPKNPSKYFIKRVIGLPLETVSIKNGEVTITSPKDKEGFVLDEPYIQFEKSDNMSYTLGAGEYFVMGDNRLGSADSRIWGPVPEANIIGRPIVRFWPPTLWPGKETFLNDEVTDNVKTN